MRCFAHGNLCRIAMWQDSRSGWMNLDRAELRKFSHYLHMLQLIGLELIHFFQNSMNNIISNIGIIVVSLLKRTSGVAHQISRSTQYNNMIITNWYRSIYCLNKTNTKFIYIIYFFLIPRQYSGPLGAMYTFLRIFSYIFFLFFFFFKWSYKSNLSEFHWIKMVIITMPICLDRSNIVCVIFRFCWFRWVFDCIVLMKKITMFVFMVK